nr:MAG TPA: hypothetical protein [Caudoviricetes sp.]
MILKYLKEILLFKFVYIKILIYICALLTKLI